ncbi:hypothetical protein Tco_0278249 [Tanacetum coccineum]
MNQDRHSSTQISLLALKIPIIKKGEYDIWSMRMGQYICHTDHNLWDIIINGDLQEESAQTGDQSGPSAPPVPKTAKQLATKRNQERMLNLSRMAIKSRLGGMKNQKDAEDIDDDDLEELDLRWQVAMLTIRVKKFIQKTGKNLDFKEKRHVSLDSQIVSCYLSQIRALCSGNADLKGLREQDLLWFYELALESLESRILRHEKNELAWGEKYEFQNYELKCREIKIDNLKMELEKVVKERDELKVKIEKWEESSKGLNKLPNSQMSAKDKNGLGYGTQLNEMSNKFETDNEISMSAFEVRSSDEEITPANDRFSKANGYHVVPPPITGNFLTPRADISFAGLDEYAIRKKIIESKTSELNTDTSKSKTSETVSKTSEVEKSKPKINRDKVIIEDWNSDDEDDVSEVNTVNPVKTNETQTVKTQRL